MTLDGDHMTSGGDHMTCLGAVKQMMVLPHLDHTHSHVILYVTKDMKVLNIIDDIIITSSPESCDLSMTSSLHHHQGHVTSR